MAEFETSAQGSAAVPITTGSPLLAVGFLTTNVQTTQYCLKSHAGRWSAEEHLAFQEGLRRYGASWRSIQRLVS